MMEQNDQEAFLLKWGQKSAESWWYNNNIYDQDSAENCPQILMVELNFSRFLVSGGCYFCWIFAGLDDELCGGWWWLYLLFLMGIKNDGV